MPTPEQLVGLLTALLQERAMPALALPNGAAALVAVNAIDAILLQDNPPGGKRFPHRVEMLTDEDDLWAVCKSKFVHIVVRLVNGQGESIDGSTLQQGGLQLELTLVNANNRATLHHNPKKPNEALFQGVAGGSYEPCAAASTWSLSSCPPTSCPPKPHPGPLTLRTLSAAGKWF